MGTSASVDSTATPLKNGSYMPGRFAPHERSLVSWPCQGHFGRHGDSITEEPELLRFEYATVGSIISQFEPVTMIAHPGRAAQEPSQAQEAPHTVTATVLLVEPITAQGPTV